MRIPEGALQTGAEPSMGDEHCWLPRHGRLFKHGVSVAINNLRSRDAVVGIVVRSFDGFSGNRLHRKHGMFRSAPVGSDTTT